MTAAPYQLQVEVDDVIWLATGPADPDVPPELGPIAPLTIRRSSPDDQLWPAQPEPDAATFGIAARSVDDVAGVVQGADCHLAYTATGNPDPLFFDGTITDVTLTPARLKDPATGDLVDGVVAAVVAVGYLAQLWEKTVTFDETLGGGSVSSLERLANLFELGAGWAVPTVPAGYGTFRHDALQVDGDALGPHLDKLLQTWVTTTTRLVVEPVLTSTRALSGFALVEVPRAIPITPVADFGLTANSLWGVVIDASSADLTDPLIDADHVDRGVAFTQRKSQNVGRVVVTYKDGTKQRSVSRSNGTSTVRKTIDTDLEKATAPAQADTVAKFYLPAGGADEWGVDTVLWRLYDDLPGRLPPALGTLVTIASVPDRVNPNRRSWITGLVAGWTLTVAGGRPVVELQLLTARGRGASSTGRLTWAQLPAGVTWQDLHDEHTWADYDLLKASP